MTTIRVGSLSPIKLEACRAAARIAGYPGAEIVGIRTVSGVPEQPVGSEEIIAGACARAQAAGRAHMKGEWAVGIENGLIGSSSPGGAWADIAYINVIAPDGSTEGAFSEAVAVPDDIFREVQLVGTDRTTVGRVLTDRYGSTIDDPHSFLSQGKISRQTILTRTIAELMLTLSHGYRESASATDFNGIKSHHVAYVAGQFRAFPIVELKSGLPAAIFNIRGDHRLAEAAGKALAARIADRYATSIDAIVMPAGKAENLAHVVARELDLDLVVPIKDPKVWMTDMVTVPLDAITSSPQKLYISTSDLRSLRGARICFLDDVISTGGSFLAIEAIARHAGAKIVAKACVFVEGDPRPDVISLGSLPFPYR